MKAKVGDRIVLESARVGTARRIGVIMNVMHPDGTPPYWVRWLDGHEALYYPGPDCHLELPAH
jgi:Domain of unknown function (DUF1918)